MSFSPYMVDPDNLDRCFDDLQESTASGYDYGVKLWLGCLLEYDDPTLQPANLTLENLVPLITEESLESLTTRQHKKPFGQKSSGS